MLRIVKKPDERRLEIITCACHLFKEKGYEKTSMQDIIDSLGIAKGTLYHYFTSKDALLESVIGHIVDLRINSMHDALNKSQGNALEKIELLAQMGAISHENPDLLKQLHKQKNSIMHIRLMTATLIKLVPLYEMIIMEGNKEGIFQARYPREAAEFLLAAIQFLTDVGLHPWTQEDLERRAKAFPSLIENLLKAPPKSFDFLLTLFLPKA